jgi:hypothetical protein
MEEHEHYNRRLPQQHTCTHSTIHIHRVCMDLADMLPNKLATPEEEEEEEAILEDIEACIQPWPDPVPARQRFPINLRKVPVSHHTMYHLIRGRGFDMCVFSASGIGSCGACLGRGRALRPAVFQKHRRSEPRPGGRTSKL